MTDQIAPHRIGVRFEAVDPASQSKLDRAVFALMRRHARARGPQHERRMAPRVELGVHETLDAVVLDQRKRGALARRQGAADDGRRCRVLDISTTGCSFRHEGAPPGKPGSTLRLRLEGLGIELELSAKLIHARPL